MMRFWDVAVHVHVIKEHNMNNWFAVGSVTEAAQKEINAAGGKVLHVSSGPAVQLVYLENVVMEQQDFAMIRIIANGTARLLWKGDSYGAEFTSVEKTELVSEYHEPREQAAMPELELGDLDEHPF